MISVLHEPENRLSAYGLNRFISKFGLERESGGLAIGYGNVKNGIKLIENNLENATCGAVHFGDSIIPVFSRPVEVAGDVVATFSDGIYEYPVIARDGDLLICGMDAFLHTGAFLSGYLERFWPPIAKESAFLARVPLADAMERMIFEIAAELAKEKEVEFRAKPFWPDGAPFALGLSHDVDLYRKTVQYFSHAWKHATSFEFKKCFRNLAGAMLMGAKNPYWNFGKLQKLEADLGVKSTVFFLNQPRGNAGRGVGAGLHDAGACRYDAPGIPEAMRTLSDSGWEVCVHQSIETFGDADGLRRDKELLDGVIANESTGVRQHYLLMDFANSFAVQESAGFSYDSTIGFSDAAGFRTGTCFPYPVYDCAAGHELNIVEIPLTLMERTAIEKDDPYAYALGTIKTVEEFGGCAVLLWHQRFFNETEFPGYADLYRRIIDYCKRKGAWIATLGEIHRWWSAR